MNNIIGNRIRRLRENKGISQEAMAFEIGVTQSNYGRLEKDDRRLNIPKLKRIAEVLGVSFSVLFDEKTQKIIKQKHDDESVEYNFEILIQADKDHILSLKEEISFLKDIIKNQNR